MKRCAFFSIVTLVLVLGASGIGLTKTWYVDGNKPTSGNGESWKESFQTIQEAIDAAIDGDQIWVAGTHTLYSTINVDVAVAIYGGFAGWEKKLGKRDWKTNVTTVDGQWMVQCFYITADVVLDGFSIINGYPVNGDTYYGGGVYFSGETATITNCTFAENWAGLGGGIFIQAGNITITECTFAVNVGGDGGGIFIQAGNITITDCSFIENGSGWDGGGISNYGRDTTISNSTFIGNWASEYGGATSSFVESATFTNCTFIGNSARLGGAICFNVENATVTNCTFIGNNAGHYGGGISGGNSTIINSTFIGNDASWGGGGGISGWNNTIINSTFIGNVGGGGGGISGWNSTIINSILWGNSAPEGPQIYDYDSSLTVTYSDVDQDGYEGNDGNKREDPIFVDVTDPDPINWDLHLDSTSPCINAGTENAPALPDNDFEGDPRLFAGLPPDMGADEFFMQVTIDIKPEENPNSINLQSQGVVQVAILSTETFYAPDVDIATCVFAGAEPIQSAMAYINDDNVPDIMLKFNAQDLELDESNTHASLFAATYDGVPVKGTDSVDIVP